MKPAFTDQYIDQLVFPWTVLAAVGLAGAVYCATRIRHAPICHKAVLFSALASAPSAPYMVALTLFIMRRGSLPLPSLIGGLGIPVGLWALVKSAKLVAFRNLPRTLEAIRLANALAWLIAGYFNAVANIYI